MHTHTRYLNYATGTMVRSSKLVPTMLVNVVWLRRSYTSLDWMAAVLLVMSAILMAVGEQAVEPAFNSLGFVLSAIYMAFNSLQGNLQDTILRDSDATVSESMFYSNTMGVAVVFCVLLYTGEADLSWKYFNEIPNAMTLLILRSLTFYSGALAYTHLVKMFGITPATAVGTARKTLTVLLSFFLLPKPFHINYVLGIGFFILADVLFLWKNKQTKTKNHALPIADKQVV
eukprot:gene11394-13467_t